MNNPLPKNKRLPMLAAVVAGSMALALVAPAFAQTSLVTMCFRNRTIQVPSYLSNVYQAQGAQMGACVSSATEQ